LSPEFWASCLPVALAAGREPGRLRDGVGTDQEVGQEMLASMAVTAMA
jgi:hypothetical protein